MIIFSFFQDKEQFFADLRKNYDNNNANDRPKVQGYTPTYITQHSQQSQQQQQQQQSQQPQRRQSAVVTADQAVVASEPEDLPLAGDYHGLGDIHSIPEAAPGKLAKLAKPPIV